MGIINKTLLAGLAGLTISLNTANDTNVESAEKIAQESINTKESIKQITDLFFIEAERQKKEGILTSKDGFGNKLWFSFNNIRNNQLSEINEILLELYKKDGYNEVNYGEYLCGDKNNGYSREGYTTVDKKNNDGSCDFTELPLTYYN